MSIAEFRALEEGHWVTLEDDQHVFIRGGRLYASMDAISEAAKQHTVKAGTRLGDAVLARAAAEKIHPDHLRAAVDAVHQQHRDQEGERLAALTDARKATGLNAGVIAAWEKSGRDYSSYPGLDAKARELAAEHPVLGLHAYSAEAVEEGDNAAQLWEMLSAPAERIRPRHDPEIIDRAADLVHQGHRGQPLRSKPVPARGSMDDVPFSAAGAAPQTFHDLAAQVPGVCGTAPSSANFARPSGAFRRLRAIHDAVVAAGARCRQGRK